MGIISKQLVFGVIGGLGLFLLGLVTLGDGLQRVSSDRMRKILASLNNPFLALLAGAILTILFQSSSATAIVIIGLLNARLLTLTQTLVVLMGANIGTTFIAQLIAFRVDNYALLAVGVGFGLRYFAKRRSLRYIGQTLLGLGLAFVGMNTLSTVLQTLAQHTTFRNNLLVLGNYPVYGFLVGIIVTALLQSSNATIVLLQGMAQQSVLQGFFYLPLLPLNTAITVLMGSNVGGCLASVLASFGRSRDTKRAALAFFLFNLVGSVLILFFIPAYGRWIQDFTQAIFVWFGKMASYILGEGRYWPSLRHIDVMAREIAMAHTVFTIVNTLVWLPLVNPVIRLMQKILPGKDTEPQEGTKYLDESMVGTPTVALNLAVLEIGNMANITLQMLKNARQAFTKGSATLIGEVEKKEELVDELQSKITLYLSTVLSRSLLTPMQSRQLAGLLHVVNDVERVGDHAHNIAQYAEAKIEDKLPFSELAINELELLFGKVEDIFARSVQALMTNDQVQAKKVICRETTIDKMEEELRQNHINRLNQGKCWPGSGVVYVELLSNLERVADHAVNIAQVVLREETIGE
ncbi:MAG TPA: Na/Pi cotransporter family protein [Firmicutes bacterium]|jgi:phosphate:Na+ symporter|nr:Na/Pi cotransporter family protein [Bacillota bacterium]HOQ23752.1 Na/Pi cotransporter family protein [Bacillota bacterium]HPT66896.1 Na/Pi cotransporter family protein [Bacillota bacterium]